MAAVPTTKPNHSNAKNQKPNGWSSPAQAQNVTPPPVASVSHGLGRHPQPSTPIRQAPPCLCFCVRAGNCYGSVTCCASGREGCYPASRRYGRCHGRRGTPKRPLRLGFGARGVREGWKDNYTVNSGVRDAQGVWWSD